MKFDMVTIHNFTDELFIGKWDGYEYPIEPGANQVFPKQVARVVVRHLVNRELEKDGVNPKKWYNDDIRAKYDEKALGEVVLKKDDDGDEKKREGQIVKEQINEAEEKFDGLNKDETEDTPPQTEKAPDDDQDEQSEDQDPPLSAISDAPKPDPEPTTDEPLKENK